MSKRTKTVVAIILGATLLLTSAFADMILGSGYLALKDSIKTTTAFLTEDAESLSVNFKAVFKEGDRTFLESEENIKVNYTTKQRESYTKNVESGKIITNYYSYIDSDMCVDKNLGTDLNDDAYFGATIFEGGRQYDHMYRSENPFNEEIVQDLEGVLDSFVGSLQDVIQLEQNNGTYLYTCNLDASQVPLYINGLLSMGIKYGIFSEHNMTSLYLPEVTKNFYIRNGSGKATANEQNIITGGVIYGEFSAEEEDGTKHDFQFEFMLEITDINSTVIEVPDLEGAEIDYVKDNNNPYSNYITTTSIGKYVCYFTDVKDGYRYVTDKWLLEITGAAENFAYGRLTHSDGEGNIISDEEITIDFSDNNSETDSPHSKIWYGATFEYLGKDCLIQRFDDLRYQINIDMQFTEDRGIINNGEILELNRIFD